MKYRRLYVCPHCDHHGKADNKIRTEPKKQCPSCGEWFLLQVQTDDGVYDNPCEPLNKMEYVI